MRIVPLSQRFMQRLTKPKLRDVSAQAARAMLGLVLPPRCLWCQRDDLPLADGAMLCANCRQELAGTAISRCTACGGALPPAVAVSCPHCREHRFRFDRVVTLGSYSKTLRECVLRLKAPGHEALAAAMGRLLAERAMASHFYPRPDAVVAVPMHWARRFVRRANNAELIAVALAAALQIPCWHPALRRIRNTRKQGPMLRTQRLRNVRGAFRLQPEFDVYGKHLLVVDDVLTTGATCNEIAKMLKRSGAASVAVAVLSRADTIH